MWKWTQRSFAGGQQDLTLRGRQDLASYFTSAKTLENFIVKRQGCISKRRGTNLIASLGGLFGEGKTITHARIIPFVYERSGGYMLLFATDGETSKMFVLSNKGILVTREEENDEGELETVTAWVEAMSEGDTPYAIEVPYAGGAFNALGYAQSGDVLWLAHKDYPFAVIEKAQEESFHYRSINFLSNGEAQSYYPPKITATKTGTEGGGAQRTISYVATYVKNGVESAPSNPVFVSYAMPWAETFKVELQVKQGNNETPPDFYNIYKKVGGEYGFIGSTGSSLKSVYPTLSDLTFTDGNGVASSESGSNVSIGQYNVNIGWNGYNPVVSRGTFNNSTASNVLSSFFTGGQKYSWPSGSSYHRGIVSSDGTLCLNFPKGETFTDIKILFGLASFSFGKQHYDNHFIEAWCLAFQAYRGTSVKITLGVMFNKLGENAIQEFVLSDAGVTASEDFAGDVHQTRSKGISGAVTHHPKTSAQLEAILNRQSIQYSFKEQIETTNKSRNDGDHWEVRYLKIEAIAVDDSSLPLPITMMELLYSAQDSNSINDDYITPDASLTPPVVEPHFHEEGKYPACVSLQNQRLALAATTEQPFTLWLSTTGDLYNFNTHNSIREDDAIEATVPATEFPEINHVVASREMLLMCDNGEWVVSPVSGNTLSYSTIQIKQQSQIGCSKRLPPLSVGDEIIFAESTNETLRSIRYEFTSDGYQSIDLSVLSQSLTRNNAIVDYAYKQHPDSIIVCVRADGSLATLTYMKEHELCAWSTAVLGGGLKAKGVCTDKAIREGTTDLYLLAQKPDGEYLLLRVREDAPVDTVERCVSLDALQVVTATETAIEAGKVAVDLDTGEVVEAMEVGRTYAVGYPFTAIFRSIPPEAQGESTIQFEIKGAKSMELRLENASKFRVIPSVLEAETDANYWTTCGDDAVINAGAVTFSKQDHMVDLAGDANTSGAVTIQSDSVWPVTILSYSINFEFDPRLLGQKG